MAEILIEIDWSYGFEYLSIDPEKLPDPGSTVYTNERWNESGREVEYCTEFRPVASDESEFVKFQLIYRLEANTDLKKDKIIWGTTDFSVEKHKKTNRSVTASYTSAKKRQQLEVEGIPSCRILEGGISEDVVRGGLANVILRGRQQALRRNLIRIHGGRCAISEEKTMAVLDVAHVIAVKDSGGHTHENAFLLRADLHRLFDAGILTISERGVVEIALENTQSKYEDLIGKPINPIVFKYIKKALKKRNAEN